MQTFLINLLIVIGLVWLTQTVLATFALKEPANKIIFAIVVVVLVLWLVTGSLVPFVR